VNLVCPFVLDGTASHPVTHARSLNISDGGVLLSMPVHALPPVNTSVSFRFYVPRRTPNTYMLEPFVSEGHVVRHEPMEDDQFAAVAVQFVRPLQLELDV